MNSQVNYEMESFSRDLVRVLREIAELRDRFLMEDDEQKGNDADVINLTRRDVMDMIEEAKRIGGHFQRGYRSLSNGSPFAHFGTVTGPSYHQCVAIFAYRAIETDLAGIFVSEGSDQANRQDYVDQKMVLSRQEQLREWAEGLTALNVPQATQKLELELEVARNLVLGRPQSTSPVSDSKVKRDPVMEERDKWLYEQICDLSVKHETILARLSKKPVEWQGVTTVGGIKKAASAYAERHQFPPIPIRKAGAPKRKDSVPKKGTK
jgi:hypothetical protein